MIALTSIFAIARVAIRVMRPKALAVEDYLVFLSFLLFLTMATLYIVVTPALFRLSAVISGTKPPYATMMADALFIIKIFFTNSMVNLPSAK